MCATMAAEECCEIRSIPRADMKLLLCVSVRRQTCRRVQVATAILSVLALFLCAYWPESTGQRVNVAVNKSDLEKALYDKHGFNALLSDSLPLDRPLPDHRHRACFRKRYNLAALSEVSVVIPFQDEHLSILMRTVTSLHNRSPHHLLKEVILVDDASESGQGLGGLEELLMEYPKVRVIRLRVRSGLVKARLEGAMVAQGQVILFLDSHVEVTTGYLPPLLHPISNDPRTVACPLIDMIDDFNLTYHHHPTGMRGGFDWTMDFQRLPLLPSALDRPEMPFESPVMSGGLFAINREYFWKLGGYDPLLHIWGAEQFELSFKVWQCGGRIVDVPCSRIGHIFRKHARKSSLLHGDYLSRNIRRVIEVWMDEYKEYVFMRLPYLRDIDPGDLTKQKATREKLQCKPFKWFLETVAFDLLKFYPLVEPPDLAKGEVKLRGQEKCIRVTEDGASLELTECENRNWFALSWRMEIQVRSLDHTRGLCLGTSNVNEGDEVPVEVGRCQRDEGDSQRWNYDRHSGIISHGDLSSRCLDCSLSPAPSAGRVFLRECDRNSETQLWEFESVDTVALDKADAANYY